MTVTVTPTPASVRSPVSSRSAAKSRAARSAGAAGAVAVGERSPVRAPARARRGVRLRALGIPLFTALAVAFGIMPNAREHAVRAAKRVGDLGHVALANATERVEQWRRFAEPLDEAGAPHAGDARQARADARRRALPPGPRASDTVRYDGYESIPGGVLYVPETFTSVDGEYDLVVHFHGNVKVVVESVATAGISAMVAVINLGIGSGPYQDVYAGAKAYEALLADVDRAVQRRGLQNAQLRRVALSGWSAGYGAISSILEFHKGDALPKLDSILIEDGIHAGWSYEDRSKPNPRQLAPFVDAAREAASGEILFSMTHSEIVPPDYAGTSVTADYMIHEVGLEPRQSPDRGPVHVAISSAEGAVSKKLEKHLDPLGQTRVGSLRIRAFKGETKEHHASHLLQMSATVLTDLSARWNSRQARTDRVAKK